MSHPNLTPPTTPVDDASATSTLAPPSPEGEKSTVGSPVSNWIFSTGPTPPPSPISGAPALRRVRRFMDLHAEFKRGSEPKSDVDPKSDVEPKSDVDSERDRESKKEAESQRETESSQAWTTDHFFVSEKYDGADDILAAVAFILEDYIVALKRDQPLEAVWEPSGNQSDEKNGEDEKNDEENKSAAPEKPLDDSTPQEAADVSSNDDASA